MAVFQASDFTCTPGSAPAYDDARPVCPVRDSDQMMAFAESSTSTFNAASIESACDAEPTCAMYHCNPIIDSCMMFEGCAYDPFSWGFVPVGIAYINPTLTVPTTKVWVRSCSPTTADHDFTLVGDAAGVSPAAVRVRYTYAASVNHQSSYRECRSLCLNSAHCAARVYGIFTNDIQ